jgi:hypothetical protein
LDYRLVVLPNIASSIFAIWIGPNSSLKQNL